MSDAIVTILSIVNRKGLHARAAARFVRCVEPYDAEVEVSRDGQSVGGDSIMGLLMLGAAMGCDIQVAARGPEAQKVLDAITELVANRFGEEA